MCARQLVYIPCAIVDLLVRSVINFVQFGLRITNTHSVYSSANWRKVNAQLCNNVPVPQMVPPPILGHQITSFQPRRHRRAAHPPPTVRRTRICAGSSDAQIFAGADFCVDRLKFTVSTHTRLRRKYAKRPNIIRLIIRCFVGGPRMMLYCNNNNYLSAGMCVCVECTSEIYAMMAHAILHDAHKYTGCERKMKRIGGWLIIYLLANVKMIKMHMIVIVKASFMNAHICSTARV